METVKPEKVVEILKHKGVEISLEQAALILEFLFKFAHISLSNCGVK